MFLQYKIWGMRGIRYNVDFEQTQEYLMRYYKNRDEKDFNRFVKSGARQFIVLIARKKLRGFKKEIIKDLEQEVANVVLLRLRKPRKEPIINMKSYLYAAAVNASYDIIKKYRLYENESLISFEDKAYQIESPEYIFNRVEAMKIHYEKLWHYFTRQMEPELMKPYQAYVFIESIKGYTCKEIAQNMPDRKFETIKSDLRDARRVLRANCVSKEKILDVLQGYTKHCS